MGVRARQLVGSERTVVGALKEDLVGLDRRLCRAVVVDTRNVLDREIMTAAQLGRLGNGTAPGH